MTEENIKKSWRNLLTAFIIGVIALTVSILFTIYGSKKAVPQVISFYGCIFGLVYIVSPGIKIIKLKRYLKSINHK